MSRGENVVDNQSPSHTRLFAATDLLSLARPKSLWQHRAMIEFRTLPDDHPALAHSPMLRAALLTLRYAQDHGAIGLTKTKAFKRVFVHWAVENFDWPGKSAEEMFRYNTVINEYEFPPLEVLHYLLISLRLGRHFKGEFRVTKRGTELAQSPGRLFAELIPFFVLEIDHASYSRFEERPFGKWDVWMNVINVEADHGTTERALRAAPSGMVRTAGSDPRRARGQAHPPRVQDTALAQRTETGHR
jgi:hypothetical protein